MYDQIQSNAADFAKKSTESAYKAQVTALKGVQEVQGIQNAAAEANIKSAFAFMSDAIQAREPKDVVALGPKSLDYVRDAFESAYRTSQEIYAAVQKTSEQLGELVRSGLQTANEAVATSAKKAR